MVHTDNDKFGLITNMVKVIKYMVKLETITIIITTLIKTMNYEMDMLYILEFK